MDGNLHIPAPIWTRAQLRYSGVTPYQRRAGKVVHVQGVNFQFQVNAVCVLRAARDTTPSAEANGARSAPGTAPSAEASGKERAWLLGWCGLSSWPGAKGNRKPGTGAMSCWACPGQSSQTSWDRSSRENPLAQGWEAQWVASILSPTEELAGGPGARVLMWARVALAICGVGGSRYHVLT